MSGGEVLTAETAAEPAAALAALAHTADEWGAEYQPVSDGDGDGDGDGATAGRLRLPVVAGLRRGWTGGTVTAQASVGSREGGTLLSFRPDEGDLFLHGPTMVVLLIAAVGGLLTVLWPFFPQLLPAASFGAVLALAGWFLVLSRLRTSGPREFLAAAAAAAEGADDADDAGE
jgi:hypothetical protein